MMSFETGGLIPLWLTDRVSLILNTVFHDQGTSTEDKENYITGL